MADRTSTDPVRLRRISRPWLLAVFAAVVLIVAAGSFVAGRLFSGTASALADANQVTIPVSARVEERSVTDAVSVQGTVAAGRQLVVAPSAPDGTSAAVVVALSQRVGATVSSGSLLGVVSNRPVFLLQTPIPFFRDLSLDDTGADVSALQGALNAGGFRTPVTGRMTSSTLNAVKAMYKKAGFALPDGTRATSVDARELVTTSSSDPVVVSEASVGDTLSAQLPLMTLRLSPDVVTARVNELQHGSFALGTTVRLSAPPGYDGRGKVTAVGDFEGSSDTQPIAGYDIQVAFDDSAHAPSISSPVVVESAIAARPSLAVPSVAIRQDDRGTYLELDARGKTQRRVNVTVTARADGWAAITGNVKAGQEVSVR